MKLRPVLASAAFLFPAAAFATTVPLQICIGGGDHRDTSNLAGALAQEKQIAAQFAALGASSHETYVRWSMIEPEEGKFTFSFQDALLDVDRKAGLRWVPFLIAGSAYTVPDWFYKSPRSATYRCLEHGTDSDIESLWNPEMRPRVASVIEAFGKHYAAGPALESVLLGVTGNYGESIYPASNLDWTQDLHGPYHTHVGWWTGDRFAVADFQKRLDDHYKDVAALNRDWGTTFSAFSEARPRLLQDWPTPAARQWQAEWALDAMTDYADFWMQEAKRALPGKEIYLVTGGHCPAYHGLDISAQAERAAERGCGIRMTNEANHFAYNFAITRMVSSACRLYGTFFSYEPAGPIDDWGIAGRVFNASSSGARCLHWYSDNLNGKPERQARWEACRPFASRREPVVDVAVFYPRRWMNLQGDEELVHMYHDFAGLRNAFDYDFVDERMLDELTRQGKQPFKALIVREDFDDDPVSSAALSRYLERTGAPERIAFRRGEPQAEKAKEGFLRELSRRVHPEDDYAPGIYFARSTDGSILFLNCRKAPADLSETHPKMVKTSTRIEAHGLAEVRREEAAGKP